MIAEDILKDYIQDDLVLEAASNLLDYYGMNAVEYTLTPLYDGVKQQMDENKYGYYFTIVLDGAKTL